MNAKVLIGRKRDGEELSGEEIRYLVAGATSGSIERHQIAAFLMAVYFRGMTRRETAALTLAMLESGVRLEHDPGPCLPADKHSTGGVGDKVSLLVAPLVSAAGVPVPMISGRSLGHTGGTLDKLETIPGFRTSLEVGEFKDQVARIGLSIACQSDDLAPADKLLYALRDTASIVESIPLITGSILSKKAAAGVRVLVLDVKVGRGAFMRSDEEGRTLAESLVEVAALVGIRARAHLTPMHRVLGRTAGNALEVRESIDALRGANVDPELRRLTLILGGSMLHLAGAVSSRRDGERRIEDLWGEGRGLEQFRKMIEAQGGLAAVVDDPALLPSGGTTMVVRAEKPGIFAGVDARPAGEWITAMGGGRLRSDDRIDPRVGLEVTAPTGAPVSAGDDLLRLHLGDHPADDGHLRAAREWILWSSAGQGAVGPDDADLDYPTVEPRQAT